MNSISSQYVMKNNLILITLLRLQLAKLKMIDKRSVPFEKNNISGRCGLAGRAFGPIAPEAFLEPAKRGRNSRSPSFPHQLWACRRLVRVFDVFYSPLYLCVLYNSLRYDYNDQSIKVLGQVNSFLFAYLPAFNIVF